MQIDSVFLAPVSGTCVMHVTGFVWYQITAPIRTLFCSKPESGVHRDARD